MKKRKEKRKIKIIDSEQKLLFEGKIKNGSPLFRVDIVTKTNAGKLKKYLIHKE